MHISDAEKQVGKECSLKGWVYRKRESGGIIFIVVRDSTGTMQAAIKKDAVGALTWDAAQSSTIESSIDVTGTVKKDTRAPTGYEMEASAMRLVHMAEPYPITEYQSAELLLDKRHLWLRSRKMTNILQIRSAVFKHIREFFEGRFFWEVTPPMITKVGGESGADMFDIDFFGEKAYLTQSSQLYLEALVPSLEYVYSMVPSFRAEKSRTTKHLAEYWHLEAESAYYSNEDNMRLQEDLVSYVCQKTASENQDLIESLGVERKRLEAVRPPFKRVTYKEAIDYLNKHGSRKDWLDDIGTEDEKILTKDEDKPVFIYRWPLSIKPFYMKSDPSDPEFALNSDMQAPQGHGELIGGSERIWDLAELKGRMKSMGIEADAYEWYLDLRRYGSIPHSGFGFGVDRFIKWALNLEHIKDAIPFPRMMNRAEP